MKQSPRTAGLNRSIARAADVLACFDSESPELGVSEIARAVALDKATVSRILATLASKALLASTASGKYRLGPRVLALGHAGRINLDLRDRALPHMRWVWQQTGETVRLNVVRDYQRICIEQIESRHELRRVIEIGRPTPLYAGAAGKLLLAFMAPSAVDLVIAESGLRAMTTRTITDSQQLRTVLAEIQRVGHAIASGERDPGGASIAVPIRDYSDTVVAALSLSMPEPRFSTQVVPDWLLCLNEGSGRISAAMGHMGSAHRLEGDSAFDLAI